MEYLVRMTQCLETFRKPELEALATLSNVKIQFLTYSDDSPFCIIKLESESAAKRLIERSILSKAIFELWGSGCSYDELHDSVKSKSAGWWNVYRHCSFKFEVDPFQHRRTTPEQREIIDSFSYVGFEGPIKMKNPDQLFRVFEEYGDKETVPKRLYLGRLIGVGSRDSITKYDLKKRRYISTTSMDAELALVTANMALASKGKIFFDPFVGTGSFLVACSHFGARVMGSDIDGRSIRGSSRNKSLRGNFIQYDLESLFLDTFVSDLTNSPMRTGRWLDGILCDPPYGIREGLKVLGSREATDGTIALIDGEPAHLRPDYVPPKRPYSFLAMLDDILNFAATYLVDDGRLSMWQPTANEQDEQMPIPAHPCMELLHTSTQSFTKWSRRLITYRRIPAHLEGQAKKIFPEEQRKTADELNPFRKFYFEGFRRDGPNGDEQKDPVKLH